MCERASFTLPKVNFYDGKFVKKCFLKHNFEVLRLHNIYSSEDG